MSFLKGKKVQEAALDPRAVADVGIGIGENLARAQGRLFTQGVETAGQAGRTAADTALDINIGAMPRIREAQMQFNPELFSGIAQQEAMLESPIFQAMQQDVLGRVGQGISFDEERALREASRGAFTSRGRFRDAAAIEDELVRRIDADQNRRLRNLQAGQSFLGLESGLRQQGIANRGNLFLDPRDASGITPGMLMQAGQNLGQGALSAGVGLSQDIFQAGADAQNQLAGRRTGGIGGKILKGLGGVAATALGGPLGGAMQGLFSGGGGSLFSGGGGSPVGAGTVLRQSVAPTSGFQATSFLDQSRAMSPQFTGGPFFNTF